MFVHVADAYFSPAGAGAGRMGGPKSPAAQAESLVHLVYMNDTL
jgi:hypothetical protein